tara:strand:+ start:3598 stop:4302 length:705 start_codon:yes stop_codon:yes gene_type:complete
MIPVIYNNKNKILIVLFTIIIVFCIYESTCLNPEVKIYDSKLDGPTILFISGTHGNEKAPVFAMDNFFKTHRPTVGKAIIIDNVNYCGFLANTRNLPSFTTNVNVNREYNDVKQNDINDIITKYIHKVDYVFDFHEAAEYQYLDFNKLGNSVSTDMNPIDTKNIINLLNERHDVVPWVSYIRPAEKLIKGSLFDYCVLNNINYTLLESSTYADMSLRIQQHNIILNYVYNKYLK